MISGSTSFTVFDTETTGLNPRKGDKIVEIAAVRVSGGKIDESQTFVQLVNPERSIPWEAERIHGISADAVKGAPTIVDVLPEFLQFAGDSILVAHNADFDLEFLRAEKEMCWGYVDLPECLCTMQLSRAVCPHEQRHNLDVIAQRLGLSVEGERHRALPDVLLTAQVLLKLIEMGRIITLDDLRSRALPPSCFVHSL
jgi:DNA polymerase III subunit epsilon